MDMDSAVETCVNDVSEVFLRITVALWPGIPSSSEELEMEELVESTERSGDFFAGEDGGKMSFWADKVIGGSDRQWASRGGGGSGEVGIGGSEAEGLYKKQLK